MNGGKGLSQEDAQKLVNWQGEYYAGLVQDAQTERAGWEQAAQQHPIYGGPKFESTKANIQALFTLLDDQAKNAESDPAKKEQAVGFGKWLSETGYMFNGPIFNSLAYLADQLIAEPGGSGGRSMPRLDADVSTLRGRAQAWGFGPKQAP